ncbi:MAG: hypothetical protein K9W44_06390 [Candidatus Lokiarchaeota archaeon]|nr:hypothetical protein [Candidatus Harpocratesius repetitus]
MIVEKGRIMESGDFFPILPFMIFWAILSSVIYIFFFVMVIISPPNECDRYELMPFFWLFNNLAFTAGIYWRILYKEKKFYSNLVNENTSIADSSSS